MEQNTYHQRARMLFGPLVRHRIIVLVMTLTIVVFVGLISYGLELIAQNNDDLLMLTCELLAEQGPDFVAASKDHAAIMEKYIIHMEERPSVFLINWLYPHGRPYKRLGPTVSALRMARYNEEAKEAINKAGEELLKYFGDSAKYAHSSLIWSKYKQLPHSLADDIENAIDESREALEQFKEKPSLKSAVYLCEDNRRTMLLLFLARSGDHDPVRIELFQNIAWPAGDYFKNMADMVSDDWSKHLLLQYADSEQRRVKILDAMLDDDMDTARELLWDAIEHAFKEKHGLRFDE